MEIRKRNDKYDKFYIGIGLGILIPAICLILFWYAKFYPMSLTDFFTRQFKPEVIMKIVSLCAMPDLALFYFFINRNKNMAARGVIGAVMLLIIATLIVKL